MNRKHGVHKALFCGILWAAFMAMARPSVAQVSSHTNSEFVTAPVNLTSSATPQVMLTASKDHQLFFKAFNDYTDLNGDGTLDTTYSKSITYYGYFDSSKCYEYDTTDLRFEPRANADSDHYCTAADGNDSYWSGNFLNWIFMSRIDVIRKILFGGHRRVDTATTTVLERSYLPHDAHSWAKYYNGNDLDKLTPFSVAGGHYTLADADLKKNGLTFCNTTDVNMGNYGNNTYSQEYAEPPLIKVAKGNYSLWAGQERWQCTWDSGAPYDNHPASNGNDSAQSGINAYTSSPAYSQGVGQKNYLARVQVCVPGMIGNEKCKLYPGADGISGNADDNYKPIGLLQVYGDENQMYFGMMGGTYKKHTSGGELYRNMGSMNDEINVNTTGTFSKVADTAGGPIGSPYNGAEGLVNAWSLFRVVGYNGDDGTYNDGDNCDWGLSTVADLTSDNKCSNWGNPFGEVYFQSLRYLSDGGVAGQFRSNASTGIPGLPTPLPWNDPLDTSNYCARLNIINLNSSIFSFDHDELDGASYGVQTVWAAADLPGDDTSKAMTDVIGASATENIHGNSYFVGEANVSNQADGEDQLCTAKVVTSFGNAGGPCPEAPRLQGSYRVAGLAYYAHIKDIRPASGGTRALTGTQKVDTYSVAMATSVPAIEIPHPVTGVKAVTILPACRNTSLTPNGNCAIVDFKVVSQNIAAGTGKFYINWEDSEQGGDYDQDMWGILEYTLDAGAGTISVKTRVLAQSTPNKMGFGYVISGTTNDGFHAHSGINGFAFTDAASAGPSCNDGDGCKCRPDASQGACTVDGVSTKNYTLGAVATSLLKDPLWYASKWGGFIDSDGDNLPDIQSEWDKMNNDTGQDGADGIPDTYFYASNPTKLEEALDRVLLNILKRTSSGTAAAVVSNNVSGEGALYQAYYEPLRQDANGNEVSWIGTIQSLWLDSYGYLREDSGVKGTLEDYATDKVIQFFYDEVENKTRVRRYTGTNPAAFTPNYMQGTVTAYDAATDTVTIDVSDMSGTIGDGPYNDWAVYNLTNSRSGTSTTSYTLVDSGEKSFVVSPDTDWIEVGHTVMVAHFESTIIDLEDLGTIWNARKQLNFNAATDLSLQRAFTTAADAGRHIKTWIDSDLDGVVDSGEYVDFVRTEALISSKYGFFDVATAATAQNVVDYIRGKEIAGYRPRKIDYDGSGEKIQRLGDIINSTPTVVPAPQEGFDLLYRDSSYSVFKKQYASRRNVLYVGANDGMLHAFNAGFYNRTARKFDTNGLKHDGTAAVAHPLGSEIWSYVPMNLLPHLKWLTSTGYEHVSYLDGKPRVFDAKIFTKDADHPGLASDTKGWGTVLVVGMRLGGGPMTIDTAANGLGNPNAADDRTMRSAYVIMDITNPEAAPRLLAEIQIPDGSFAFTYPAVMTFKDNVAASDENKWYLVFGSGPQFAPAANFVGAKSTTTAKLYALDMAELTTPGTTAAAPVGCSVAALTGAVPTIKVISCDTAIANTFVGSPVVVDWDLDYKADTAYFGLVGDANANTGRLMKMVVNEKGDPAEWKHTVSGTDKALSTLINTSQPVSVIPTPGMDNLGNKWVFFGTGRLYVQADKSSTTTQSLYGIKDSGVEVARNTTDLVNATNIDVYTNGSIDDGPTVAIDTLSELIAEVDTNKKGWYLDLPPIVGTAGSVPATRNLSESALVGGVLFSSVYQPSTDACTGEGLSRLYGLYYKTGTAYDSPTVFGVEEVAGLERSKPYIDLGRGFATAPAIHSGSGTGDKEVSVFTQLSTGTIIRSEAGTVSSVRSGFRSWREAY